MVIVREMVIYIRPGAGVGVGNGEQWRKQDFSQR